MDKTFNNFNDLEKALNKSVEKINGPVSFTTLFNESFMKKYTNFSSFDELLSAGGYVVNSEEDFKAIPDDEFDNHVSKTTKFASWSDMSNEAGKIYVANNFKF